MSNNEIISVVIPVYNRERLIGKTIKSILEQTYNNFEILIIDDNSTDGTKEAITKINDSRIRYFKQEYNQGPSAARNRGINVSKGNYIAFLDSDDLWDTNKLSDQFKIFDQYKDEYDVVFSGFRILDLKTGLKIKESIISESICDNFKNGKYFFNSFALYIINKKTRIIRCWRI
jgi:glycosyltransferase involved in cell wall biosynthesis